eukprot:TRINITY_DN23085_c0_g1_i1.p1 TRINITY_DN23085_c0_g1~~TRINITY_DN23085_c0_g1_i1.p1  ORF type:complete len:467 (+),score=167.06 TRINITY_DN23085_c0_g1_i1:71-1471(+)
MATMTHDEVVRVCKELGFYSTPELNERLYLHCKGYVEIAGLEEFVNAKALWLEGNGLDEIKGLEKNTELMTIYLGRNALTEVAGLNHLKKLARVDLAENYIEKVRCGDLKGCDALSDVSLRKNSVKTTADVEGLVDVRGTLSSLDLSHNSIADESIISFLATFPNLVSLRLMNNPIARKMPTYRKSVLRECTNLKSFDDTPVTAVERKAVEGFWRGGFDEERRVRAEEAQKERDTQARMLAHFDEVIEQVRARRQEGHKPPHTEYYNANHRGGPRPGENVSEELVDAVFDANAETAERDAQRQRSLRPKTDEEKLSVRFTTVQVDPKATPQDAADALKQERARHADPLAGLADSDGDAPATPPRDPAAGIDVEIGSDWDSDDYESSPATPPGGVSRSAAASQKPPTPEPLFTPLDQEEEVPEDAPDYNEAQRLKSQRESAWARGEAVETPPQAVQPEPEASLEELD